MSPKRIQSGFPIPDGLLVGRINACYPRPDCNNDRVQIMNLYLDLFYNNIYIEQLKFRALQK
jgi:hypothetical protein